MTDLSTVFKFMAEYYELGTGFGPRVKKVGLEQWSLNNILEFKQYLVSSDAHFPMNFLCSSLELVQWTPG